MAGRKLIRKREHREVKFSGRTRPKKGVFSIILWVLALILMSAMILLSAAAKGQGDWYLGAGGLAALLLTVIGFILAVRCFRMNDIYYGLPTGGAILNGLLMLAYLALYTVGFLG